MSELLPALDKPQIRRILRDGIRIDVRENSAIKMASKLEALGLIRLQGRRYVRCVYELDPDYEELEDKDCDGIIELSGAYSAYICPNCGRPIDRIASKAVFEDVRISLISKGIVGYVRQLIEALPIVDQLEPVDYAAANVWLRDGRTLTLTVIDFAEARFRYAGQYFAEPFLHVIASPINEPGKHVLEEGNYVELADLLSRDEAWLTEKVDLAAHPIQDRPQLARLEALFDSMLSRRDGWQYFEQQFVPDFYAHVDQHPTLVSRYLSQLKRWNDTVLGYFSVPIGGAGRTDLGQINKLEIMNELFRGGAIADAKRYVRSALELKDFREVLNHLMTAPTRPRNAVIFTSTDKVRSSVWDELRKLRNNEGYWKIIVLTKYMILELLAALDACHLLSSSVTT